jgi:branched-chain amino acid transport system permease protein
MFANWRRKYDYTDVLLWIIGGGLLVFIIWGSYVTLSSGKYTLQQWLNFAIFGLAQGGIYALIALGYTMVYGILGMINFAHGEFFMFGTFGAFFMASAMAATGMLESNPILAILLMLAAAMLVSATIAVLAERIAYRPLRRAPRLVPLITAIGVSYFLQYTARGLFGSGVEAFPNVPALSGAVSIGPIIMQRSQIVVFAATAILLTILWLFVSKTKIGRAIRSVAEDKDAAALMGVDVDRTIAISFAVGGIMAGAAGVMYGLVFRQVAFYMGFVPGLKAFTAAVLGGIGNLAGAVLGGLILGVIESVGPSLFLDGMGIPAPHQLKDGIAFTVLVLILIFRPTGILGERLSKRA